MAIVVARPTGERAVSTVRTGRAAERFLLLAIPILALIWLLSSRQMQPTDRYPTANKPMRWEPTTTYIVERGDTVDGIAAGFDVSRSTLIRTNHLTHADLIRVGQTLLVPGGHPVKTEAEPTPGLVRLIVRVARRFGVNPRLAVALAWQESRLRQHRRSSKGAVGVMQVEPATAAMAARQLGRRLDITHVGDNVTAGLYWLSYLLRIYGDDEVKALAAYYEGEGNLARYGYPPTVREYVASVMALWESLPLGGVGW